MNTSRLHLLADVVRFATYLVAVVIVVMSEPLRDYWERWGDLIWLANSVLVLLGGRLAGGWISARVLKWFIGRQPSQENSGQNGHPPVGVRRLDMADYQSTHSRFWALCRRECLQIWTGKCVDFIFPKKTLSTRAIPFAIMPHDRHADALDQFFQKHSPSGVDLWSAEGYHYGTYRGHYDRELRGWAAGELPFGTFCFLAVDVDLVQISFKDFEFTLLAGSKSLIEDLEQQFGGATQMKSEFLAHLDSGEFGMFTPGAPEWGAKNVLPLCGWGSPY